MAPFWDTAPRSLIEVVQRFKGDLCSPRPDDGGSTLKRQYTSTRVHRTVSPEGCHFHTHMNLKSHIIACHLL
jgi:hypothetical protein